MQKTTMDEVKKMLTEIKYPVSKQDLLKAAKDAKADDEMIKNLNNMQDKDFMTSGDVMKELHMEDDLDDK